LIDKDKEMEYKEHEEEEKEDIGNEDEMLHDDVEPEHVAL